MLFNKIKFLRFLKVQRIVENTQFYCCFEQIYNLRFFSFLKSKAETFGN